MAKLHLEGGIVFEGTPEEIKAYANLCNAEEQKEGTKPEQKLKAGDFVIIDTSKNRIDITAGKAYEVLEDEEGDLYFFDDARDERRYSALAEGAYTIAEAPKPPTAFERLGRKEGEFKVGDVVRVIDAVGSDLENGDVGIITKIDNDSTPIYVSVPNKFDGGNYQCLDDVELIAPVESRVDRPCA